MGSIIDIDKILINDKTRRRLIIGKAKRAQFIDKVTRKFSLLLTGGSPNNDEAKSNSLKQVRFSQVSIREFLVVGTTACDAVPLSSCQPHQRQHSLLQYTSELIMSCDDHEVIIKNRSPSFKLTKESAKLKYISSNDVVVDDEDDNISV